MKNNNFFKSLKCALSGLFAAFSKERNIRIEFAFANLIIIFAYFFGISQAEWAILILTIFFVLSAELFNTAIENAVDTATDEIKETAKTAKDSAAAAVLASAAASVIVGFILFFDTARIYEVLKYIFTDFRVLIPCLIVGAADVAFIIWGDRININLKGQKDEKK